jgi:hypothetical protein
LIDIHSFAALWSIGLERYAPFFEERGVYTVEDFRKFRNDSEVLCLELELDPNANKLLSELSSADAKFFSCSLAKLQDEFHSSYDVFKMMNFASHHHSLTLVVSDTTLQTTKVSDAFGLPGQRCPQALFHRGVPPKNVCQIKHFQLSPTTSRFKNMCR